MKMQMGKSLWKNISKSLGTRYVKYGGLAALITVAVIVAVIFLNLIVQQFSPQFDLTEEKIFSLSDQSRQILESVKDPVKIYGIWAPGSENPDAREIAELYTARNSLVSFEAVDPDLHPGLMQRFDRDGNGVQRGSLVVEGAKGFKPIAPSEMYDTYVNQQTGQSQTMGIAIEKRISSALIYVSTGESPVIYEITGHEGYPLEVFQLKEKIEAENYILKDLSLFQSEVPQDASVLILNNPKTDLSSSEAERILAYLENGGRLLVMMDVNSGAAESVNGILASYGLRFDRGFVVEHDLNHMLGNNFTLIPDMLPHDISQPLIDKESPVVIQFAMGVSVLDMRRRTVKAVPYLQSSSNSFLRTDLQNDNPEQSAGDIAGPLIVAAAVMDPEYAQDGEKQARIAVIGGESLLAYTAINPPNMDLFMNSLNWIADRPQSLTVESRSLFTMPLDITAIHALAFGLLFVIIIPLTLFILALVTWLRRRHL